MAQDILIKRSSTTAAPSTLENGELAYSSNSGKLFIGRPGGAAGDVDAIGGKVFTDKLDGIEAGATADQTAGEIKTAYESNANTNAYTDAEKSKLAGVETSANNYELADLNSDLAGGVGNIVTTGYLRGPSNFVIDPATHGNDTGTLTIAGDLVVNGTTTTVNSTEINLADNIINLNSAQDEGSLPPTSMVAGLQVDRGSAGYDAYIMWRELSDKWFVSFGGPYDYELLTAISDLDGGTF
jgi:hypothetical protein